MTIETFIADHLRKRLADLQAFVVYDETKRYNDIVHSLANDTCTVVDGSASTILGREQAEAAFRGLASDDTKHLVIYVPAPAPKTDDYEARRRNPYEAFSLAGGFFPDGDGEAYQALCRQAVPDRVVKVDELFAAGAPAFAVINNLIAGSTHWPKLRTLLNIESAVEIIVAVLSPTQAQEEAMKSDETWVPELRQFLDAVLGLKLQTKAKRRAGVATEIGRFVLFSEFTFDLPGELPAALQSVPRADPTRESLVYGICDRLRGTEAHHQAYMELATVVAEDLQLLKHMQGVSELGDRDTFAFEERMYLKVFKDAALAEDYGRAVEISRIRNHSIWVARNGERKQLWTIADRALNLIKLARDLEPLVSSLEIKISTVLDFYCDRFRKIDTQHRSFEQAVAESYGDLDTLDELVSAARRFYRQTADSLQSKFLESVTRDGWPVEGRTAAAGVFDRFVAPWIKDRKKTAYFFVDALRYELAAELLNELTGDYEASLDAVCGQLPGITQVGMASLMPGASGPLKLEVESGKIVPYIGAMKVYVPDERMACVRSVYGDMCEMRDLDELVTKKLKLEEKIFLLLVKTTDIDVLGESSALEAHRMMPHLIRKLLAGIRNAAKLGFQRIVLATDHGFLLLDEIGPGNVVEAPSGDWAVQKNRFLLGKGSSGKGVRTLDADAVGIPIPGATYAVPAGLGAFSRGNPYYHGGMSLQECVLPVLSLDLTKGEEAKVGGRPEVALSYKGMQGGKITTRRPMIEISVFKSGLFDEPIEFSLSAHAGNELVGEAGACDYVNNATGLVCAKPGDAVKVPLRMDEEYQGVFEVRAVDPVTLYTYAVLKLKTDYLE
jgi:hypothetical protein